MTDSLNTLGFISWGLLNSEETVIFNSLVVTVDAKVDDIEVDVEIEADDIEVDVEIEDQEA